MPEDRSFNSHPPEDVLELFVLGRLKSDDLASLEEHLLLCNRCQESVEEIDAFVYATRRAASQLPAAKPRRRWTIPFALPKPALAGAGVLLLIAAFVPFADRSQAPQDIELSAMRGTSAAPVPAPANRRLHLKLDATELSASHTFTVELVNSRGLPQWEKRDVPAQSGRVVVDPAISLDPGQYWVRLYSNSFKNELLREYGLSIR